MNPFTPIHGWLWLAGCLTTTSTIIIAAAGGHKPDWPEWKHHNMAKATTFGLANGIGMLLSSCVSKSPIPGLLLLIGAAGFSLPIVYKCFTDDTRFSKVTMYGGMSMIGGWLLLGFL